MLKRQKVQGPYGRPSSMKRLRTLTRKSKCFTFESYLYFMSLNYLKAPLNLFQPFFLSPVIKLHMTIQMTFKVWVESTYFFLYGIQIRAIWIMICRMFLVCRTPIVIDFHIFSCIFLQFLVKDYVDSLSDPIGIVSEIITHLMNLFWIMRRMN